MFLFINYSKGEYIFRLDKNCTLRNTGYPLVNYIECLFYMNDLCIHQFKSFGILSYILPTFLPFCNVSYLQTKV